MDKTIKERTQRLQERDKERGIVSLRVRVPKGRRGDVMAICAQFRKEAELAIAAHREMIAAMDDRG